MQPTLCARCKKNLAVIYITKIENGQSTNEGLCLKCAKELNIKPVDDIMKKMGISEEDLEGITNEMMDVLGNGENMEALMAADSDEDDESGKTATFPFLSKLFGGENASMPEAGETHRQDTAKDKGPKKRKHLDNYCISLTNKALNGKLDRMIGRETELERVIQILNRRQKNNPCLIGEPGVGKTAIAEGLAQRIVDGKVPYKLKDKEVLLLDLTALVAGTQFRGQFESRMKGLIDEVKKQGNVILVIDEIHNIVGAGEADGAMNAANILKPALSRGEIQVIGATTFAEYRKHIEKDSALERRFQPVTVSEPSVSESIEIIRGIAPYYEEYHDVRITDEVARQAVLLSERYITDRFLPDKAIDLIDEACSDVNLKNKDLEKASTLQKELNDLSRERELLLTHSEEEEGDFARLAELRSREMQINEALTELASHGKPCLEVENLARIIELWTKIPASSIREDEHKKLAELNVRLKQHIIGQDEAVDAVCAAIKRNRVGISARHKPVSFIFVGSTGVGKTELVKRVAADLFDTPDALIRFDMSEFMEKYAVSRMIGSPPGYVGYDEAGQLTEKVRRKPYSVVLFDEIEKAHPDVLNILLQILDDGRISDAHGRVVNFENTVIIMTSNAGSEKSEGALGFNRSENEHTRDKAIKALKEFLRPEFINRVDEVVCFHKLSRDDFRKIAGIMMEELKENMAEKGMTLQFDASVIEYLTEKAYSEVYGARNLRREIQRHVEDKIANVVIAQYQHAVKHIGVTVQEGDVQVHAL